MDYYPLTTTATTAVEKTNGFSTTTPTKMTTSTVASEMISTKKNVLSSPSTNTNSTFDQILINQIKRIYHELAISTSLEPGDHTNGLFTELVDLCITHRDPNLAYIVLNHPMIQGLTPHLRSLCATGEYLLELQWAKKLTKSGHRHVYEYELSDFPYADNYKLLVRLELHALLGVGANLSHIVFIGSGPLPLSSLEMIWQTSSTSLPSSVGPIHRIDNIDKSQEAIDVSKALAHERFHLQEQLQFYCQDALDFEHYTSANVIVLGALVGATAREKKAFLCHIINKMKSGAILMMRSSNALRELLYPNTGQLLSNYPELEPLVEIHPQNQVVNSVILAQKI